MKNVIHLLVLLSLLFCLQSNSYAMNDPVIDGFTNFLATRAQADAEAIYEIDLRDKITNNKNFQCYLPNTAQKVNTLALIDLIKSSRQVWIHDLSDDLKFTILMFTLTIAESKLQKDDSNLVAFIKNDADLKKNIPLLKNDILNILKKLESFDKTFDPTDQTKKIKLSTTCFNSKFDPNSVNPIEDWLVKLYNDIGSDTAVAPRPALNDPDYLLAFKTYNEISTLYSMLNGQSNVSYSAAAIQSINLINEIATSPDIQAKVKEFSPVLLFFSALADAKTSSDVEIILQNNLIPPVSFAEIRNATHTSISSFVGVDYSHLRITNDGNSISSSPSTNNGWGIFAPVGLERSFKTNIPLGVISFSSYGVMISPFDFGYPLSLKINASNNAVTWADIINPSIALSFGLTNQPVNLGFAIQRVNANQYNANPGVRSMLFLSFDIPLYIVH